MGGEGLLPAAILTGGGATRSVVSRLLETTPTSLALIQRGHDYRRVQPPDGQGALLNRVWLRAAHSGGASWLLLQVSRRRLAMPPGGALARRPHGPPGF
jgi:hypothetical protein